MSSGSAWIIVCAVSLLAVLILGAFFHVLKTVARWCGISSKRARTTRGKRREWIGTQTPRHVPVPKINLGNGMTTTQALLLFEVCYSVDDGLIVLHDARMSDGRDNGGNNAISFRGWGFKLPERVVTPSQLLEFARVELAEPDSGLKRRMFWRWNDPR